MTEIESTQDFRLLLSNALGKIRELKRQVAEQADGHAAPIAVVGIGCRFACGISGPDAFWRFLIAGGQVATDVSRNLGELQAADSVDAVAVSETPPTSPGSFLTDVDFFDASFFGISAREARSMDPQHRLLLEVSWEALEHAGMSAERWYQSPLGVFVGISSHDYAGLLSKRAEAEIDEYLGTGISHSTAAGRISHLLGFRGPSMAVDTACSSSLVAVHLACQSLRTGECNAALVGGVNVVLLHEYSRYLEKAGLLSPSGRCKTFDAAADGVVRGEGCGMVVLKKLSAARAEGDNVLAVIRGSAVNHDGPGGGLTVPNGPAQQALIRQALSAAGVSASEVGFVEAHGAGTSLGDTIEIGALAAVYGRDRQTDPLLVASHKTNFGHLEAAGGIAGLIKATLSLGNNEIPPHVGLEQPNPQIDWDHSNIRIPTQRTPWPASDGARLAGVSSFSFCGTNAHVVLAEAIRSAERQEPESGNEPAAQRHILTLSAKSQTALDALTRRYAEHLLSAAEFADICFTSNAGRSHFDFRLAVVAGNSADAAERLGLYLEGRPVAGLFHGVVSAEMDLDRASTTATVADSTVHTMPVDDDQLTAEGRAKRYVQGDSIDGNAANQDPPRRKVPLPTYPFQRERFWVE